MYADWLLVVSVGRGIIGAEDITSYESGIGARVPNLEPGTKRNSAVSSALAGQGATTELFF